MLRKSWMKVALVGASLVVAGLVMACGGEDNDGTDGETGSGTAVAGEATETPAPLDDPTSTPTGSGAVGGTGAPAPPSFPTSDEPPVTTASANGESVETGIGTYCWTRMCVDKIGVPTKGTLMVSQGDIVSIVIPEDAPALNEAAANVFEAVNAQALDDGSEIWPYPGTTGEALDYEITDESVEVTVDLAPGSYVLAVGMYFEAGDVVYGVLLEVQ